MKTKYGICFDCGNGVARKQNKRCRSCSDAFRSGANHPQYKHGLAHSRFNVTYKNIKRRCANENSSDFSRYGGKGIKCLWSSFEDFKKDMYESYLQHVKNFGEKQTTIDRIDNNGNYSKENCRWATMKEQARNKRVTRTLTVFGKTQTIPEWGEEYGISPKIIRQRIDRDKLPLEIALIK